MRRRRHWRPNRTLVLAFVGVSAIVGAYWLLLRFFSPLVSGGIIVASLFLLAIAGGYRYNWRWTGVGQYSTPPKGTRDWHHRKTLWDWMQLLIIPVVLAGAALGFNIQNARTQQVLTTDNQREAAFQKYIDEMSTLLVDEQLRTSQKGSELQNVARTRTLSTLRTLDGQRKGVLLQFLQESQLISNTQPIVALRDASLTGAELSNADLTGANLTNANLTDANLIGASIINEQLTTCRTLNGATLPDGTKVPDDVENPFR